MWRLLAVSLALALAGCAVPPERAGVAARDATDGHGLLAAAEPAPLVLEPAASGRPWPPGTHALVLDVGGQAATGLLSVPQGEPIAIAVLAHGWGGDAESYRGHLESLAARGAVAVAMDFRGERGAFKVQTGVEDTVAATRALQQAYPSVQRTLLYGWSMGGEVALLAATAAPPGTYDYAFVGAGVTDLQAFWESYPLAQQAIEEETGGPPTAVPEAYAARSPVLQAGTIAAAGMQRVFVVHGGADNVVPVDHAERLVQALEAAGQPVSFYLMTRSRLEGLCLQPGACAADLPAPAMHDAGAFGYLRPFVEHRVDGLPDPDEAAVRGTYDGYTGKYEPSDVGR